jgi:ClpP class serine protease
VRTPPIVTRWRCSRTRAGARLACGRGGARAAGLFTGYDGIETKILDAENDPGIAAKALVIDSGGGDVAGLFDLVDLIWSMNAKNGGKPTYAICADHAYSAAFAIATAADKVWVPRTGGVGSVGVITLHADYSEQLASNGIKVTVIRSGAEKFRAHPAENLPAHTQAHIQAQIDEIRAIFIETVARNMGISKKSVRETEALDYMGAQAKAIGFVNEVGSKHQAWYSIQQRISR